MRIGRMLVVAVALLVAVGVTFAAAETMKVTGAVKSVDVEKSTLVVAVAKAAGAEPTNMTFTVTKETRVSEGDAAKTLADLKAGLRVTVEYTATDAALTATSVTVVK